MANETNTFEIIDIESRLFDGMARLVLNPGVDPSRFTKATTLSDVLNGALKDLGKIVEGSGSWEGDEGGIEVLKSTEGGVIRSKTTDATFAYGLRVPHSVQTAKIAGAKVHTATSLGGNLTLAEGEEILGMNPKNMTLRCPAMLFNYTRKEIQLFPKATVLFSPTRDDDDLQEYSVKVQAEDIETKHLSTMMFIPLGKDPFEVADDEDNE